MTTKTHWNGLLDVMGRPAWAGEFREDWLEFDCTKDNVRKFREHFRAWIASQDKIAVTDAAQQAGGARVPVNTAADLPGLPEPVCVNDSPDPWQVAGPGCRARNARDASGGAGGDVLGIVTTAGRGWAFQTDYTAHWSAVGRRALAAHGEPPGRGVRGAGRRVVSGGRRAGLVTGRVAHGAAAERAPCPGPAPVRRAGPSPRATPPRATARRSTCATPRASASMDAASKLIGAGVGHRSSVLPQRDRLQVRFRAGAVPVQFRFSSGAANPPAASGRRRPAGYPDLSTTRRRGE